MALDILQVNKFIKVREGVTKTWIPENLPDRKYLFCTPPLEDSLERTLPITHPKEIKLYK